jgi:hypothetical protein
MHPVVVRMALEKFDKKENAAYENIKYYIGFYANGHADLEKSHRLHLLKYFK